MANCHFDQIRKPVPVGVLTDLNNNIIMGNFVDPDTLNAYYKPSTQWAVSGARVMITRFWASSTASIVCVPHVPGEGYSVPEFPEALGIEREFCVWLGYIEAIRGVNREDLNSGNLVRVFTGVVDNNKATASEKGGYTVMIQARDRMKFLMDSEVYYSTTELQTIFGAAGAGGSGANNIPRSRLIQDIARRSVGGPPAVGFAGLGGASERDVPMGSLTQDIDLGGSINPYAFYDGGPLQASTRTTSSIDDNPSINIITTRVAIGSEAQDKQNALNFLLNGQVPLDIIKSIAFQEVYPTEFFQDHRDGNYYYGPRANDSSGLNDSDRFRRTYYFNAPDGAGGNINQNLVAFREEFSSIGMKTNFFVSVNSPLANLQPHNDYVLHLASNPYAIRNIDFAPKFHRINDPTIKTPEEAAIVALSAARIYAKETNVAMSVNLGDPSFCPGEVVQVFGSPLLEEGGTNRGEADRQKYSQYEASLKNMISEYASFGLAAVERLRLDDKASATTNTIPRTLFDGSRVTMKVGVNAPNGRGAFGSLFGGVNVAEAETVDRLISQQKSQHQGSDGPGFNEMPRTIWRIEAVHHKFNLGSPGFTSELALVSPF